MNRPLTLIALLSILGASAGHAQPVARARSALWVGAPLDDYVRVLQLTGALPLSSRMLRPLEHEARTLAIVDSGQRSLNPWRERHGDGERADTGRFSLEVYHPVLRLTHNSAVPFGGNDGALWAGRGLSGALDLGVAVRYGPLTVRVAPTLTYSQNREFTLGDLYQPPAGMSPYADPYIPSTIDMPQRFGNVPVRELHLGQSSIQLEGRGVRVGAGTENMWWGPGMQSALLMSDNAPGFRHAFLGTSRPVDIWIGKLEALYTVGRLDQSNHWRATVADSLTRRWLNALALVFEPRGAPGLYLGATRAYYAYLPPGGLTAGDLFTIFQPLAKKALVTPDNPTGDDARDQMIELFARWVMPASGFEMYGSYGRNDHSFDQADFELEPDHAMALSFGFQKLFLQREQGFVRLRGEATSLASTLTQRLRASPTWYAHYVVTQGYTQRGQVIGSALGPGGRGASGGVDLYRRWGSVGLFADWRRLNDDAFYRRYDDITGANSNQRRHDVILGTGLRGTALLKYADLSASVMRQKELNRYTIPQNNVGNVHVEVGAEMRW